MYLESRKVILEPYLNSDYQRFYWTQRFNCDYFLTLLELYLNLFGTIFAPNLNFASTLNLNLIWNWTLFEPNLNLAWTIKNFIWSLIEPCLNLLELFINQLIVKLSPENLLILNIKTGSHKKVIKTDDCPTLFFMSVTRFIISNVQIFQGKNFRVCCAVDLLESLATSYIHVQFREKPLKWEYFSFS